MRLVNLTLKNYRRFAGEESLELNENLIALVGPNEAGKSSVLHALELVGSMRGGSPTRPASSDTTRGSSASATLEALFVIEDDDRAALATVRDGERMRRVEINVDSARTTTTWDLAPRPTRDLTPRKTTLELLGRLGGDPALDPSYSADGAWSWDPNRLETVETILSFEKDSLESSELAELEDLANRLESIEYPRRVEGEEEPEVSDEVREREVMRQEVAAALREQAEHERQPSPWHQVVDVLKDRLPQVVMFSEADREILSDYQLADVANDPPPGLRNLCKLAEIDLAQVNAMHIAGERGDVEHIFEKANDRLKLQFQNAWRQSDVYPRFSTPLDGLLRVFVAVEGDAGYSEPAQRSDGLRWFMALHAFLVANSQTNPIVLVDEAETHLHYDAQADLIDAFMSQQIAQKIVYTTHSVGCLPPDLGCGIRVVLPDADTERSHISNSYWSVEPSPDLKAGYTPLLFAMGARLLSLTVPRFGVVGEGPSEAILLPSLFRLATESDSLPYRVVPGISEVHSAAVQELARHAGKAVFIVDGDHGGANHAEKLKDGGVPEADLFSLADVSVGCTLEDLVSPEVYAWAVNSEIETWDLGSLRVDAAEVPTTGRGQWLKEIAAETSTKVESLRKQRVAQRMVDAIREAKKDGDAAGLLADGYAAPLRELHHRISVALGVPGASLGL